jgi:hypothetical protein
MLNLSPLFFTSDETEPCLHTELALDPAERDYIARAKTLVRSCLRAGIPAILKARAYTDSPPQPRFFTQGSWAYGTLNSPAHRPPQQADIDDGCYLPMSFVAGATKPSVAAAKFFEVAEAALAPLCRTNSWALVTDKPTCIRIVIAAYAHIDVPLYAIPDREFETLSKAAREQYGYLDFAEAVRKAEKDAWTAISKRSVLLAHREEDWIESDPRPVKQWFLTQVEGKGEQLRRVVRYLKAFRDWTWHEGGPSSILLMAAAAPLFEKRDRRDDLALLDVVAGLPKALRAGVKNPVDDAESLTDRLGKERVEEAATRFEEFERMLRGATQASDESQACTWMRQTFGPRFPGRPDRVIKTTVAATIAAAPAAAGPSELVGRTKAG